MKGYFSKRQTLKFLRQVCNEYILDFINRLVGRRVEKGETGDQVPKTMKKTATDLSMVTEVASSILDYEYPLGFYWVDFSTVAYVLCKLTVNAIKLCNDSYIGKSTNLKKKKQIILNSKQFPHLGNLVLKKKNPSYIFIHLKVSHIFFP